MVIDWLDNHVQLAMGKNFREDGFIYCQVFRPSRIVELILRT